MKIDDVLDALKQCVSGDTSCEVCPLICCFGCRQVLLAHALETINSQKSEIERLKQTPKCIYAYDGETIEYCVEGPCSAENTVDKIKTKAIKEFADRMKGVITEIDDTYIERIVEDYIDKLVKEMTEGT